MEGLQELWDVLGAIGSFALIVGVVIGVLQLPALHAQRQTEQVLRQRSVLTGSQPSASQLSRLLTPRVDHRGGRVGLNAESLGLPSARL